MTRPQVSPTGVKVFAFYQTDLESPPSNTSLEIDVLLKAVGTKVETVA